MLNYTVRAPVLLLVFNRPDTTQLVFDKIKEVKPSRLYIAADGPREESSTDPERCRRAREIIEQVNWPCDLKTLFNETNKGCRTAVSAALNWFFGQEQEGIILEDDCIPARSFFYFCDVLLEKYRYDSRIFTITGTNLQLGIKRGNASYYFSQYTNVWGWASWQRVWEKYDRELKNYEEADVEIQLKKIFRDRFLIEKWMEIFKALKVNKIDTWDYQLNFLALFEHGLCATPNINLISNIGFRDDATHTPDPLNHHANLPTGELDEMRHPQYFIPDQEADYFFMKKEFHLEEKWRQYEKDKLLKRRVKGWFKELLKNPSTKEKPSRL